MAYAIGDIFLAATGRLGQSNEVDEAGFDLAIGGSTGLGEDYHIAEHMVDLYELFLAMGRRIGVVVGAAMG
jgi:hypothetical protein